MMIHLSAKDNAALSAMTHEEPLIAKITVNLNLPNGLRSQSVLIMHEPAAIPDGFGLVLLAFDGEIANAPVNTVRLSNEIRYLKENDVIKFYPTGCKINVLYRKEANVNTFLLTERCNSFCIMCSQPPRDIDDNYLVDDILEALPLIHPETPEIGFSGGETTLIGNDSFTRLIQAAKNHLPNTSLHILSNGRNFKNLDLAIKVSRVQHPDVMIGIPLYADYSQLHDFIVQADGAFDETIRGILNLKRCQVPVEIRVVIHRENYHRLPRLAEFITRNLLFVDHVALMGLEIIGFAKSNQQALWIDPYDYRHELQEAVETMAKASMKVSIYNTPFCVVPESIRCHAVKSISDWKNDYLDECSECNAKQQCGGFFSWNLSKPSLHIRPL
ncbi:His-Xaa-Ser system radical SAM maturase HxsC (plasmid) [Methylomonas sp. MED-D]|uniref:His-Xaa-Ser system radical SAM maturase HxsC n=1 Tax=Methylomonas sp. MED-D TaxID=3418768 RepID=UPI003D088AC6